MITDINQLDLSRLYTFSDYLKWKFDERVELIRGLVHRMSPAPGTNHQLISGRLFVALFQFLEGEKKCKVFAAPFDVRLPRKPDQTNDKVIDTVVQPDLTVVCDEEKLDDRGCLGAPNLVVEILSPGNTRREMKDKFELYQNAGIPEYWLVDPEHEVVTIYKLNNQGHYLAGPPATTGMVAHSDTLSGFSVLTDKLFGKE